MTNDSAGDGIPWCEMHGPYSGENCPTCFKTTPVTTKPQDSATQFHYFVTANTAASEAASTDFYADDDDAAQKKIAEWVKKGKEKGWDMDITGVEKRQQDSAKQTPRYTVSDARPSLSEIPYHCHEHGWWSALKESGCPSCVSVSRKRIRQLEADLAAAREALEKAEAELERIKGTRIKELYYELLYQVCNKYSNETRHQTALRYIRQAENQNNPPSSAALTKEPT